MGKYFIRGQCVTSFTFEERPGSVSGDPFLATQDNPNAFPFQLAPRMEGKLPVGFIITCPKALPKFKAVFGVPPHDTLLPGVSGRVRISKIPTKKIWGTIKGCVSIARAETHVISAYRYKNRMENAVDFGTPVTNIADAVNLVKPRSAGQEMLI